MIPKFRAWVIEEKKMYEVGQLCWWNGKLVLVVCDRGVHFPSKGYKPEEVALMQYTGSKDSGGTDIYEGDILEIEVVEHPSFGITDGSSARLVVEWEKDWGAWSLSEFDLALDSFEIIGNIYENPELVKGITNEA